MHVNECTKSVQAKGTKTVVAAAVAAMISGVALAAVPETPTGEDVYTNKTGNASWADLKDQNVFDLNGNGPAAFLGSDAANTTFDKKLWVIGDSSGEQATGLWTAGAKQTLENTGTIYVKGELGEDAAVSWQLHAMGAANGATATNNGVIEVENAYGMYVGSKDNGSDAAKIVNGKNGTIKVAVQGAGMELGGVAGSTAINEGTITVEAPAKDKINEYQFTHGVLIQDQSDGTFVNKGVINAADATSAIEVKGSNTGTTKIILTETSDVNGLIHVAASNQTALHLEGTKDVLKLHAEDAALMHVFVTDGADVTLEDGLGNTLDEVNIEEGRLTASIWQADNKFGQVTVAQGGIFDVTKLNSRLDGKKIDLDAGIEGDQLLVAFGTGLTLSGGELWQGGKRFTGNLKVGANQEGTSGLVVTNGSSLTLSRLETGSNGKIEIGADGSISTTDLHISKGTVLVNAGGRLAVANDITYYDSTSGSKTAQLELGDGTIAVDGKNVFVNSAEGGKEAQWGLTEGWSEHVSGMGIVEITNKEIGEIELDQLREAQNILNKGSGRNDLQLVFVNGTLKVKDNAASVEELNGLIAEDITAVATGANAGFTQDTTVAGVDFSEAGEATDVKLAVDQGDVVVTLSGNNGDLFTFAEDAKVKKVTAGDVVLGTKTESTGTVNVAEFESNNLTVVGDFKAEGKVVAKSEFSVEEGASFVAEEVLLAATNKIAGHLKADKIADNSQGIDALADDAVTGIVETHEFAAHLDFAESSMLQVYGKNVEGAEGKIEWEPALVSGVANIQKGALFTTDAVANHVEDKAVAYINDTVKVTGQVNLGTTKNAANGQFTVGSDGLLIVDAAAFTNEKAAIEGTLSIEASDALTFKNLNKAGSFKLADAGSGEIKTDSGNVFLNVDVAEKTGEDAPEGLFVTASANKNVSNDADFNQVAEKVINGYGDDSVRDVLAAIGDKTKTDAGFVADDKLTELGVAATEEFLVLPVTAGVYNVAYDAAEQVNGAIMKRNVKGEGMGVWADVFYASNEAKNIYGGQGYSADIYGGVLGFDTTFSCGAKLGAAVTIGTGDADSEKSVSKFSNDADFYGISLYTGKNVGDTSLYIGADMSYLWIENDLKGTVAGVSADESLDSTAFTIGLRADWTAYEGVFSVVPHAGIRYTALDVDDYRGIESHSMNVLELPVGVKVAGAFEPAAGWKLVPSVDFTITPQVGDKSVDTVLGEVDVIDNLYNTTVGVEAVNGSFSFGLTGGYGFGNDDRQNASVNANVRYAF